MTNPPLLTGHRIVKSFGGVRAVDGIDFSVGRGTITGLIGPNGAGKTTLFNCIAGLFPPTSGEIRFEGARIDGLRPPSVFRRGIARTFQIPRPFPLMTVLENVMIVPQKQRGERFWMNWIAPASVRAQEKELLEKAREALAFVGLDRLANEEARVLSGGQKKLLELARALVAEPRLVLLDEPGAGVAPKLLGTIVDKIAALNERGITFLVIEHNMDVVMSLCRPILVMAQGRLVVEGDPATVRSDPRVLEAYLGGAPA